MATSRYLQGLPRQARLPGGFRVLLLWVLLIVLFLAIWQFLSPAPERPPASARTRAPRTEEPVNRPALALSFLGVFGGVSAIVYFGLRKKLFPPPDPLLEAEMALLCEGYDEATSKARDVIANAQSAPVRAQALILLARLATMRAEFADAEELSSCALSALGGLTGLYRHQMEPLYRARRAFALAALGRSSEAEADLGKTTHPDASPGTQPIADLARAVLLARHEQSEALRRHIDAVSSTIRRALTLRERTLLRALAAYAKAKLEPAMRTAGSDLAADPEILAWIGAIVPNVARAVEAR